MRDSPHHFIRIAGPRPLQPLAGQRDAVRVTVWELTGECRRLPGCHQSVSYLTRIPACDRTGIFPPFHRTPACWKALLTAWAPMRIQMILLVQAPWSGAF